MISSGFQLQESLSPFCKGLCAVTLVLRFSDDEYVGLSLKPVSIFIFALTILVQLSIQCRQVKSLSNEPCHVSFEYYVYQPYPYSTYKESPVYG